MMRNRNSVLLDKLLSKTPFTAESGLFLAIVVVVHILFIAMMIRPAVYTAQITKPMMGRLLGASPDSASGMSTAAQDLAKSLPAQENSFVTSSKPQFSIQDNHQVASREVATAPTKNTNLNTPVLSSHVASSGGAPSSTGIATSTSSGTNGSSGSSLTLPNRDAGHLNNPKPLYSAVSRRMGEEGQVMLSVYILADGNVGKVAIKKSSGYKRLDEAALTAVRSWRYVPAHQDGKAVPYWYTQPILFSLND